uniref:Uncharacterized protein n=1 Tax=Anguilla anguilla TaxID=7936 RepID=A0A0E9VCV6_ANGAN
MSIPVKDTLLKRFFLFVHHYPECVSSLTSTGSVVSVTFHSTDFIAVSSFPTEKCD